MISERYAVAAQPVSRPAPRTRTRKPTIRQQLARRPATAGRERLADALGGSLVIQLMLVMSLVVFAALIYLNQASHVSVLQYNISDLQIQQGNLRQVNAQLNAAASTLQSPARIENAAVQFHMTKPEPNNTVWITVPVPQVQPIRPVTADITASEERSSPKAWVTNFVNLIHDSL